MDGRGEKEGGMRSPPDDPRGRPVALGDLPREVVEHIATFIGPRIRDLAAAYIASPRLFGSARPRERAIEWGAVHTYRLIKADPPFEIFAEALERRDPATLYRRLIKPAARRGRVDILRALHGPLMSGIEGDHVHDDGAADAGKPAKAASNDRMAAEALGAAAAGGHVEAMRFLLSRGMFGDRYVALPLYDPTIMAKAMANGRLEAVKYLHDLALTDDRQCACNPDHHHDPTWASDNPDVPDWLRDHGCEAYQEPGVARIIDMIFDCRCRMLRYALPRSPLAVAPPGVDTGAALRRSILGHHRRYIDAALQQAARNARVDVLAVAHEAGLYDDAFPILVGAAQNCCVDVMEWAASTGQIDGLTRVQARALVAGVCSSCAGDAAGALEWIVGRFGIDVVDRAMIAAAFHHFRLDAVRWIEARLLQHDRPFDWASLVPGALRTGYVAGLRYLVEEKRVRIETSHIVAAEAVGHRALGYVLSRSPLSVLQDAVDIMGTRLTCKDIETLECVRELAPQLCVSIAAAACSVSDALIHVTCECARCLDDAHVLGVAESSTAASKRAFPIAPDEVDTDHSAGACPAPKRLMLSPQR